MPEKNGDNKMGTKGIGAEVFGDLQNVVPEKNGDNKIVRESN